MIRPGSIETEITRNPRAEALRPGSARVSRVGFGVSPKKSLREVRDGQRPSPARETRALPGQ
jgi:hypothetical protein